MSRSPLATTRAIKGDATAGWCWSLATLVVFAAAILFTVTTEARAMKIQEVKSPGGITAWLVEEHSVPLLAVRFSFEGGSAQDPVGKEGVANFLTAMMDEGAGDLDSLAFQERMEEIAMRMSFSDSRDAIYGSFETLTKHKADALAMLKLAITKPRFDEDAVERIKGQLLSSLAYQARDPNRVAARAWSAAAFPGHAYGRSSTGSPESVATIKAQDLETFRKRTFARSNLKVVAVGDIDAAALATLLDDVFGSLPATPQLTPIEVTSPVAGGMQRIIEMDVPQSVAVFGFAGIPRKDPDFVACYVVNHILGSGSFASRLMEEVREKRGLAYSVYSYLQPYTHAAIFAGSVATKNESIKESLDVIKAELDRLAKDGPTDEELANAKSFLTGSYPLSFDTNAKIANQLLGILREDLGIAYVENRNDKINGVTIEEAKRAAARMLRTQDLIVTIVGKPAKMADKG